MEHETNCHTQEFSMASGFFSKMERNGKEADAKEGLIVTQPQHQIDKEDEIWKQIFKRVLYCIYCLAK